MEGRPRAWGASRLAKKEVRKDLEALGGIWGSFGGRVFEQQKEKDCPSAAPIVIWAFLCHPVLPHSPSQHTHRVLVALGKTDIFNVSIGSIFPTFPQKKINPSPGDTIFQSLEC